MRRDVCRREPRGTGPAYDPQVFKTRFLLLRRGDNLKDTDQASLDKLFDKHPRLKAGWQALHELHGPYLADDETGAHQALGRFRDLYATGELPELHKIVDAIINWSDEILAPHHTNRASNGRIDRTNNLHPSPTTHRPRLHQPQQLRSPWNPDNMTPNRQQQPQIPRLRAGSESSPTRTAT